MMRISYLAKHMVPVEITIGPNDIEEAFNSIPENIMVLRIISSPDINIEIFPSLGRFLYLRELCFINIKGIRILPDMSHLQYLKHLNIQECSIETLENIPILVHLVLKNNVRLNIHTIPQSIDVLECVGQNMGDFTIPFNNMITKLHKCVVLSITNISICHEYMNKNHRYIFDMTECISPYQSFIDETSKRIGIPDQYTNSRCDSQSITILPYIIDIVVNRELLLDFGNNMICVRNSTVQNKPPNNLGYINTVFVLGSNYPRRMMEFI